VLRIKGGAPFRTDSGNFIYDVKVPPIASPGELERALRGVVGVVEVGLFVQRAQVVWVASERGVERLEAQPRT